MTPNAGASKCNPLISRLYWRNLLTNHGHILVAGSAWISRGVMAFVQLGSIRILMGDLGLEQYAMFALLMGLLQWYMLTDIGLGVSIQNRISECRARELPYDATVLVAAMGAFLLLMISIFVLYQISPYMGPKFLKAFSNISDYEKSRNFFITGAFFTCAGIGNIAYKIWYAEQRGYLAHIFPAAASLLGFAGIMLLDHSGDGGKIYLSLIVFNAPAALLPFLALFAQFGRRCKSIKIIDQTLIKTIVFRAIKFWFVAVLGTVVLQIDYIVISQLLSPHDIVTYVLSTKIFGFVMFFFSSILWALWPKFTEAISRGEWKVVQKGRGRCIKSGMIFVGAATLILVVTMQFISEIMAPGQAIKISVVLTLLLGGYHLCRVGTEVDSVILQSMNTFWPLWVLVPVQALICVGLQYKLTPIYGVYGIVMGLIGSYILTVGWGLPLAVSRQLRKSHMLFPT